MKSPPKDPLFFLTFTSRLWAGKKKHTHTQARSAPKRACARKKRSVLSHDSPVGVRCLTVSQTKVVNHFCREFPHIFSQSHWTNHREKLDTIDRNTMVFFEGMIIQVNWSLQGVTSNASNCGILWYFLQLMTYQVQELEVLSGGISLRPCGAAHIHLNHHWITRWFRSRKNHPKKETSRSFRYLRVNQISHQFHFSAVWDIYIYIYIVDIYPTSPLLN